jgi:hypothetical protein
MFEFKPDFPETLQRMEAFWQRELTDRPVVQFILSKPTEKRVPLPVSHHADAASRWLDTQYQVELALANLSNQEFLGDTLPIAWPNLGPEVFSAMYGCPLHFGDYGTSWTDPNLFDWNQVDQIKMDWNSPYLLKLHEMTDALLEAGKEKFITGMTDWHPGADCLAAFRDPQNLAMDMIEHTDEIKALLQRITEDYFQLYDSFYTKLRLAGQPITSWTTLASELKFYIPSNDFSIMISKAAYDDVFLQGIVQECQFYDRSIYHLDGPGALRHLDSILSIPELDALQWIPGVAVEEYSRWVKVYQQAQSCGKGIQVNCRVSELELIMQTLNPRGLYLNLTGVTDHQMGLDIIKTLEKWNLGFLH